MDHIDRAVVVCPTVEQLTTPNRWVVFERELKWLINRQSIDNELNTPDHQLASEIMEGLYAKLGRKVMSNARDNT